MSSSETLDNKLILALVYLFGIGPLGFDRIVVGCYASGLVKLFLFILSIFFLFVFWPIGILGLIIWGLWALVDTIAVLASLLTKQDGVPLFCPVKFDPATQTAAFYVGIFSAFLVVLELIVFPLALATS